MSNKEFFLDHLGQTSPFPFLIEVEKAEGINITAKSGKVYMDKNGIFEFLEKMKSQQAMPDYSTPEEMKKTLQREVAKHKRAIATGRIRIN
jgi:predicted RNA-binding protein (virulence factor B family)